jgi:hypothetical protein
MIDEEKILFTIVDLVNPVLVDVAKELLVADWNNGNYK